MSIGPGASGACCLTTSRHGSRSMATFTDGGKTELGKGSTMHSAAKFESERGAVLSRQLPLLTASLRRQPRWVVHAAMTQGRRSRAESGISSWTCSALFWLSSCWLQTFKIEMVDG